MRPHSPPLILFGTLFSAAGYGATFLVTSWFLAQGGSELDAGTTLSMALLGTLLGVPLVGWCAGWVDAARLAALGALAMAVGYLLLGSLGGIEPASLPRLAAMLIGLGWGMFYLGAPLAMSERLDDSERGPGFTRFSAFQMTGICGSPIVLAALLEHGGLLFASAFLWVGIAGLLAAVLLASFGIREPRSPQRKMLRPWVRNIRVLAGSVAIRPILMAGLGGAVFSGMMAFQGSLTDGSAASASTFFALHAGTAVLLRLLLVRHLSRWPRRPVIICLLGCLVAGLVCLHGSAVHPAFHAAAAILTGAGYGLLYPVIQTWAVNASALENRHAALTWFVVAYFIGIFGFPALGGWLLVAAGTSTFIWALAALAMLELAVATVGRRAYLD
ncbi:putative MFS family arabinose efflux permease [Stenotrophomonas maltophilia]|uniref:MFS transporter n=1 Tax=Stenotrophomonas chelatiphaga TaxID=517011 RepID=UPI000F4B7CE1|nr:MFS transporter [Stenotrophomonas chelatiphaga]MCS4229416.1 MFS family permease [Stenotrophomonas chelatiphaga]ROQ46134.1 putative MFS family arabinose efflux permease [Stenotrophomonas maltophilia]